MPRNSWKNKKSGVTFDEDGNITKNSFKNYEVFEKIYPLFDESLNLNKMLSDNDVEVMQKRNI